MVRSFSRLLPRFQGLQCADSGNKARGAYFVYVYAQVRPPMSAGCEYALWALSLSLASPRLSLEEEGRSAYANALSSYVCMISQARGLKTFTQDVTIRDRRFSVSSFSPAAFIRTFLRHDWGCVGSVTCIASPVAFLVLFDYAMRLV